MYLNNSCLVEHVCCIDCLYPLRVAELGAMSSEDGERVHAIARRWQCPNRACRNYRAIVDTDSQTLPPFATSTIDLPISVYPTLGHIAARFPRQAIVVGDDYHYSTHRWTYQVTVGSARDATWFSYVPFGRDDGIYSTHHTWEDLDMEALKAACPGRPGLYIEVSKPPLASSHLPTQVWSERNSLHWKTYDGQSIPFHQLADDMLVGTLHKLQFAAIRQCKREHVTSYSEQAELDSLAMTLNGAADYPSSDWSEYLPDTFRRLLKVAVGRGLDPTTWEVCARSELLEAATLVVSYARFKQNRRTSTAIVPGDRKLSLVAK